MTDRIGVGKSSPSTAFYLEADVLSYNVSGGYATVRCYLRAVNTGTTGSFYGGYGAQAGYINGGHFGTHSGNPFLPSGYGNGATRWRDGPYDVNIPMSAMRTVSLVMALAYGSVNESHSTNITIPWAPAAPSPIGIDQIKPTSLRYRFSGNSNNGSAITGWQAQIATNAAFTTGVQTVSSSGTTTFTNLQPATKYYLRSRGINGVGVGAWSAASSATTMSGAYVSISGTWVPVPVYVSNGTSWVLPELFVSDSTNWDRPL